MFSDWAHLVVHQGNSGGIARLYANCKTGIDQLVFLGT